MHFECALFRVPRTVISCGDIVVCSIAQYVMAAEVLLSYCHVSCLQELIEVNGGAFNDRLRKAVKIGKKHVRQCLLCSQKGFICETCHSSSVIYPFDMKDTYQV